MTKSRRIVTAFLLVAMLLTSCSETDPAPDTMEVQNKINAAVAQTLSALTTKVAAVQTTEVVKPTQMVQATPTKEITIVPTSGLPGITALPQPTKTAAPGNCSDMASYVGDMTIPDGTNVPPGTTFEKTWAVRNSGSCTWNSNYKIVWFGADPMGAPNQVQMTTQDILPGQTAYISVSLTAPTEVGRHVFSQWKLMNPNNQVFGVMDNKGVEKSIWAEIFVSNTYNFIDNMCSATWKTSSGVIPCAGTKNDPRGFVYVLSAPPIEGGVKENDPAIVMVPPEETGSYIVAQYPPIVVAEGANLVLHFGCLEGYTKCNVRFKITYSIEGGPEQELINRVHGYGEWESISENLTMNNKYAMMDKSVAFLFYFYPMEGSSENYAFIFNPILTP